jgi:hypothetical protein
MSCSTNLIADIINDCTKRPTRGIYPTAWIMPFEGRQYTLKTVLEENPSVYNEIEQLTAPAINFYKIEAEKFALNVGSELVQSDVKKNGYTHKFTGIISQVGNKMLDTMDGIIVIVKKGDKYLCYGLQNGLWKSAQSRMVNDNSGLVTVEFSSRSDMEEDYSEYFFNFGELDYSGKSMTANTIELLLSICASTSFSLGVDISGGTNAAIGTWSLQAVADKANIMANGALVTNNV